MNDAITEADKIDGWMTTKELRWLNKTASQLSDVVWVEVGSWAGRSLACVGASLQSGELIAVDRFSGCPGCSDYDTRIARRSLLEVIDGINQRPEVTARLIEVSSVEAAKAFDDESVDVVFIDGDHDYASVRDDLNAWLTKVKSGGIICGHDGKYPTVISAVIEVIGQFEMCDTIWYATI